MFTLDEIVARLLARYEREGSAPTLLGIGPMSTLVVRAALEVGRDAECPVMLIASRNQVDAEAFGGGYVQGWTQAAFAGAIREAVAEVGFVGPLFVCRDHGGPWHRDEELRAALPLDQAMASALESYRADVLAGFNLIHVDPTRDPSGKVPLAEVTRRSLALIQAIEATRREQGLPAVSYEIGTEETSGGLTGEADFAGFIRGLLAHLQAEDLPRPAFIVGQTGTLVKADENVGAFDAETARHLATIARAAGLGLKEHNADYLPDQVLAAHPGLGITAANVAPEFGVAESKALLALADREEQALADRPSLARSRFRETLTEKVLASGRWRKWLRPTEKGTTEADLRADPARLQATAAISGHYVFADPEVVAARQRLYENARALGLAADPERTVLEAVKASIMHYVEPFGLTGLNRWLAG